VVHIWGAAGSTCRTDPLRILPTPADVACYPGKLGDTCSSDLAARAARSTRRTASYDTRVPISDVTERLPLFDPAFARLPMRRAGSSSEDQVQLEGGQAETQTADRKGLRKWQRVPGRRADRLYLRRVFRAGYVPGATDGSMPVGSGSVPRTFPRLLSGLGQVFFVFPSNVSLERGTPHTGYRSPEDGIPASVLTPWLLDAVGWSTQRKEQAQM
jgi:hypothetical protein